MVKRILHGQGVAYPTGGADVTAPALQGAAIPSDGMSLALTYNQTLDAANVPNVGAFALGGTPATVVGVSIAGAVVTLALDTPALTGQTVTLSYTPGASPIQNAGGVDAAALVAQAVSNGSLFDVSDAAFWIDASQAASYTDSAGTLTSLRNLVNANALSSVTGTPKIVTDPRDAKPAFSFGLGGYVTGADATYQAAVAGTDKPFTSIAVVQIGDVTAGRAIDSVKNTGNSGNGQEFLGSAGAWYYERDGAPSGPARLATSEGIQAGLTVLVQHSADGLTVKSSQNGGTESTAAAFASAGALTPNVVGVGIQTGSTNTFQFDGVIRERIYFGSDKSAPQIAAMASALLKKWRPAPVVYFVGDSITAASLASNGGMVNQLVVAARADGLNIDPQGPFILPNGSGGEVWHPLRCSAASGNTCAQMNTRVISDTQGLGKGGTSKGYYQRTRIVFLFAGTNGVNAADYGTLLDNIYARCAQHGQPSFRIVVTPITDINGSTSTVTAYNAAIAAKWATFEAANPGVLIYWDAFQAAPWNGTDYVDSTHPGNSGYVKLVTHPTYGLYRAVKPYLTSIQ